MALRRIAAARLARGLLLAGLSFAACGEVATEPERAAEPDGDLGPSRIRPPGPDGGVVKRSACEATEPPLVFEGAFFGRLEGAFDRSAVVDEPIRGQAEVGLLDAPCPGVPVAVELFFDAGYPMVDDPAPRFYRRVRLEGLGVDAEGRVQGTSLLEDEHGPERWHVLLVPGLDDTLVIGELRIDLLSMGEDRLHWSWLVRGATLRRR